MRKRYLGISAILACLGVGSIFAATVTPSLSMEQAEAIALSKIPGGKVVDMELEQKLGKSIYEIEVCNNDYDYELKIDAITGQGISSKKEACEGHRAMNSETKLTSEEAKAIALKEVPGATIQQMELDKEKGIYELELKKDVVRYEVEISAQSGDVLKCELED